MAHPIDLHVLLDPDRAHWHADCLGALAGQPVNIHALEKAPDVTVGRLAGLAQGAAPYVTWTDDDDRTAPGLFADALAVLDAHPEACGVYASEISMVDGYRARLFPPLDEPWSLQRQVEQHPYVHNGFVLRREAVEPVLPYLQDAELFCVTLQLAATWYGPWVHLPRIGNYWRRHSAQASRRVGRKVALRRAQEYGLQLAELLRQRKAEEGASGIIEP